MLPMRQEVIKSVFTNTNPVDAAAADGKLTMSGDELTKMNFIKTNTYRQFIKTWYSDEFNGVRTF
jgi:hypothetical protein